MIGYIVTTFFDLVNPEKSALKFLNLLLGLTSVSAFAPMLIFCYSISINC